MIIYSKFNIGQQVRHKLLGFLGVIIDIDPIYSLTKKNKFKDNINKKKLPWYHVIIEDKNGYPIHTYLSEDQLSWEINKKHPQQKLLDKLSYIIKKELKIYKLKN